MSLAQDARNAERRDTERRFVETLRSRYVAQGYDFEADPEPSRLPAFMGGYRPDAIAFRGSEKIAIEVNSRSTAGADGSLPRIRQLFEGHKDWHLHVIVISGDALENLTIGRSTPEVIFQRLIEARELLDKGYVRAAFLACWPLLEAIARLVDPDVEARPHGPGTIVQSLAMLGRIDGDAEQRLRALIDLRNRIVHGDLAAEPLPEEVGWLLSTLDAVRAQDGNPEP